MISVQFDFGRSLTAPITTLSICGECCRSLNLSAPLLKCPSKEIQYGRIWTNLVWKRNYAPKLKYAPIYSFIGKLQKKFPPLGLVATGTVFFSS